MKNDHDPVPTLAGSSSTGGDASTPVLPVTDRLALVTAEWIARNRSDDELATACMRSTRLSGIARRAAFVMRLDEADADDLRQDLILYLLANGRNALAEDPSKVYAWLSAVAKSAARGRMRRRDQHTVKLDAITDSHGDNGRDGAGHSRPEERLSPIEYDYAGQAARNQAMARFEAKTRQAGGVPAHLRALAPLTRTPVPPRPVSDRQTDGAERVIETPLYKAWRRSGYTRRHIARLAGVAVASVTVALRGEGSATVRARVEEVILSLPEQANSDASALVRTWMDIVSPQGGTERQQIDALSKVTGIGRVTLYYWFKGTHQPTSEKLIRARDQVERFRKAALRKNEI
ncbi:hypothetical protein [Burkholderia vietnamiensis]|uniref:hypothetical protein n=1 Tax=Burkholderia vietnamiensis TaxID=60552 RepID=UPI000ACF48FB|nr:hypothetical protein [Burkholderia vietnamiensis]MBR8189144.1 hypothetical protein [Burkholderia vietnamiensis]